MSEDRAREPNLVDLLPDGEATPGPRSPVRSTRAVPVAIAAALAILSLMSAVAAGGWWHDRSRPAIHTVLDPNAVVSGVDAGGCPPTRSCSVSPNPLQGLYDAALEDFADADVLHAGSVFDAATGQTFRTEVVLRTRSGIVVWAAAQCVPRGARVPDWTAPAPSRGPADVAIVVGGPHGCSVAVTATVPAGVAVPAGPLNRLVRTRAAQLTPNG